MRRRVALAALATTLAGCGRRSTSDDAGARTARTGSGGAGATVSPGDGDDAYTHLRSSGNRVVGGAGALPSEPVDVPLDRAPAWVVGVRDGDRPVWVVVREDGRVRAFETGAGPVRERSVVPGRLPAGAPPAATTSGGTLRLLAPPDGASPHVNPLALDAGTAHVADGALVRERTGTSGGEGEPTADRLDVGALPDGRLVRTGGRVFALAGVTGRYDHGVLGDGLEAGAAVVVDAEDWRVEHRIDVAPAVVEGIAPLAADVEGDGEPEVIVTLSDADRGARVAAFGLDGGRIATGPAIGQGYRWRHQLAVAPFGPGGETELAAVRTPHIGGTAEFYRLREGRFEIVAERAGYSSHAAGSRNLDGGLAGDLDGDGRTELLVPTDDRGTLAALRRTGDGVEEAFRLPVGGRVRTNLHAVGGDPDPVAVAVGRADALRVWE